MVQLPSFSSDDESEIDYVPPSASLMPPRMVQPQPWCKGPKLEPFQFKGNSRHIDFISHLGSGLHSHVFKASIDGKIYALKMFKFISLTELNGRNSIDVDAKILLSHSDPFNCECRAYGRLKETDREDLAAKSYGYIVMDPEHERTVAEKFHTTDWDRRKIHKNKPIRAIVKDFVEFRCYFERSMVRQMKRNILDINRLGIQVYDIRWENYHNGILIDLSQAKTVPHYALKVGPRPWQLMSANDETLYHDYYCLDMMIRRWNRANPRQQPIYHCFHADFVYLSHLRKRNRVVYRSRNTPVATKYDWKKAARLRAKPKSGDNHNQEARQNSTKRTSVLVQGEEEATDGRFGSSTK